MKRVVVTGGAGFIGSHLAEKLARQRYYVIILDDLSTGKMENIRTLIGSRHVSSCGSELIEVNQKNVAFIQGNITDITLLQELFQGVHCVFHHAALARALRSIDDPLITNEVNIKGTLNVLIAARDNGVRKVIYASSSSVYGNTTVLPQVEDMTPNPLSPYALTKLAGEYYCDIFRQIYGLSTICLRYFSVYGSRQDPNSRYAQVCPAFIERLSQNRPPIVFGDGEQSRDFTFIADIVRANILAMESDAEGIYNIGSGRSVTINQLVETLLNLMQIEVKPIYNKPRPGDPRHTLADISKARAFGYEPEWTLSRGLAEVIKDIPNHYEKVDER